MENHDSSDASWLSQWALPYGLTVIFVGATLAGRFVLLPILGNAGSFLFFFLPILFSSWLFGHGPGIFATALSVLAVEAFVLPSGSLGLGNILLHLLFIVAGVWVALFASAKSKAEQTLKLLNSQLDLRVSQRTHELQSEVEQRRAAELMLRRQAQLLQLTHDAILVRSFHKARILFWNKGAEKLYGWPESEALGKISHVLLQTRFPVPRESIEAAIAETGSWEGELIHTAADGRQVIVASRWSLRPEEGGEPAAFLEIHTDITARKEAEQKSREKEHLATVGTAAAVFAHEVSNPLNSLFAALQVLQLKIRQTPEESVLLLESAIEEVRRLEALLKEFRELARPQSFQKSPVNLSKIIQDIVALQHPVCESAGISLRVDLEPLPELLGDSGKIRQAILNIFKNAVEAMPQGGHLTVATRLCGKSVNLEISDTGPGIPEEAAVFDPFVTTKPDGLGLGLPIVRAIVAAHNGTLCYTTEPGKGTTFIIRLPLAEAAISVDERKEIEAA